MASPSIPLGHRPFVLERVDHAEFLRRAGRMMATPADPEAFKPATGTSSAPVAVPAVGDVITVDGRRCFPSDAPTPEIVVASPADAAESMTDAEMGGVSMEESPLPTLLPSGVVVTSDPTSHTLVTNDYSYFTSCGVSNATVVTALCASVRDTDGDLWSVNAYNVVAQIGAGSCGAVYLVELVGSGGVDFSLGHEFALKVVPRNIRGDDRAMANEAAMMMMLNGHPHIVTLYEVIDDPEKDSLLLVMEYLSGGAIATIDAESGKCSTTLDATEMAVFVTQQASALTYVHSTGLVHGDYKVENVLFTGARGAKLQTKLADFGVAVLKKVAGAPAVAGRSRRCASQPVLGTPYIRSPEAFAGGYPTPSDDAWAFGVVLHTLVTGRIPFAGGTLAGMAAAVAAGLPTAPAVEDPPLAHDWWPCISRLLHPTSPDARVAELDRLSAAIPMPSLSFSTSAMFSHRISHRCGAVTFGGLATAP